MLLTNGANLVKSVLLVDVSFETIVSLLLAERTTRYFRRLWLDKGILTVCVIFNVIFNRLLIEL